MIFRKVYLEEIMETDEASSFRKKETGQFQTGESLTLSQERVKPDPNRKKPDPFARKSQAGSTPQQQGCVTLFGRLHICWKYWETATAWTKGH